MCIIKVMRERAFFFHRQMATARQLDCYFIF